MNIFPLDSANCTYTIFIIVSPKYDSMHGSKYSLKKNGYSDEESVVKTIDRSHTLHSKSQRSLIKSIGTM